MNRPLEEIKFGSPIMLLINFFCSLFMPSCCQSRGYIYILLMLVTGCQSDSQERPESVNQTYKMNLALPESSRSTNLELNVAEKQKNSRLIISNLGKTKKKSDLEYADLERKFSLTKPEMSIGAIETKSTQNTKIGILLPLSGVGGWVGRALLDAIQLALFETADDRLELLIFDTKGLAESAIDSAESLIKQDVGLILGPLFGESTEAIAPIARDAKIPVISFSNDKHVAGNGVFVFGFLPEQQISRILKYSFHQGYQKVGTLTPATEFGSLAVSVARDIANEMGGIVVREIFYDPSSSDFTHLVRDFAEYDDRKFKLGLQKKQLEQQSDQIATDALNRLSSFDTLGDPPFEAVLLPSGGQELRRIAPLLAFYDVDPSRVRLLGSALWDDMSNLGVEPALLGAWYAAPSPRLRMAFKAKFKKIFGYEPPRLSTLGYDAMLLGAALTYGDEGADYSESSITNPSGFLGIDGIVRLLENGTNERGLAILEVGRDGIKVIDSAPNTFIKKN
jgi:branched-chain amino acid transport system substrate-binding protein